MRRFFPVLILSSLGLAVLAETLTLPPIPSQNQVQPQSQNPNPGKSLPATTRTPASQSVVLPGRGMTMTEVEEKFGIPLQKFPEVGDPPIIRWVYPDFTVYFEYHYVINAVPNHLAPRPAAPAESPAPAEAEVPTDAGAEPAAETPPGADSAPTSAPAAE